MQRPNVPEFFRSVLETVNDLPERLAEGLQGLLEMAPDETSSRANRIQELIEESSE